MKIKEGDTLPDVKVFIIDKEHKEISTKEILNKDKVILFGVPGAFTPTCSNQHLPSFIKSNQNLKTFLTNLSLWVALILIIFSLYYFFKLIA